jgi:hypothetical protein
MGRAALLLLTGLAACSRAAPRIAPLPALPFALDSSSAHRVGPGVVHRSIRSPTGPWAIEVLEVSLDRCTGVRAVKGFPGAVGRERTSVLLERLADTVAVLGGVNAGFFLFDPPGVPTNALVIDGRVFAGPNQHPVLAFDSAGTPHLLTLRGPAGQRIVADAPPGVGVSLAPLHPMHAVGGRPIILAGGAVTAAARDTVAFAVTRHPRTAVGIAEGGRRLLLVVVDGRQPEWSIGMRLDELAELMLALGADDAINLDGGGSSVLVWRASAGGGLRIGNRPSDREGERAVADALAVVDHCRAAR